MADTQAIFGISLSSRLSLVQVRQPFGCACSPPPPHAMHALRVNIRALRANIHAFPQFHACLPFPASAITRLCRRHQASSRRVLASSFCVHLAAICVCVQRGRCKPKLHRLDGDAVRGESGIGSRLSLLSMNDRIPNATMRAPTHCAPTFMPFHSFAPAFLSRQVL